MKILVCGSRTMPWKFQELVLETLRGLEPRATLIIQGAARGADTLAKVAAIYLGIPWQSFPADWDTHGKKAGPVRNQQMLDQGPDLVIAFYPVSGCTSGTADMIRRAKTAGVEVREIVYGDQEGSKESDGLRGRPEE